MLGNLSLMASPKLLQIHLQCFPHLKISLKKVKCKNPKSMSWSLKSFQHLRNKLSFLLLEKVSFLFPFVLALLLL